MINIPEHVFFFWKYCYKLYCNTNTNFTELSNAYTYYWYLDIVLNPTIGTNADTSTNASISTDSDTGIGTDAGISTDIEISISSDHAISTNTDSGIGTNTSISTDTDTSIGTDTDTSIFVDIVLALIQTHYLDKYLYWTWHWHQDQCWYWYWCTPNRVTVQGDSVLELFPIIRLGGQNSAGLVKNDSNDRSVKLLAGSKRVCYFDATKYFLRLLQALELEAALCRRMRVGLESGGGCPQFEEDERGHILHEEGQGTQVSEQWAQPEICTGEILVCPAEKGAFDRGLGRERRDGARGRKRARERPPNLLAHLLSSHGDVMGLPLRDLRGLQKSSSCKFYREQLWEPKCRSGEANQKTISPKFNKAPQVWNLKSPQGTKYVDIQWHN